VNYESIAHELADRLTAPPAPWSGTRDGTGGVEVPVLLNRTPDAPEGVQVSRSLRDD